MLLYTGLGIVREDKQYRGNAQHHAYNQQASAKCLFYLILKKYAYDAYWNHRHHNVQGIFCFVVHLKLKQSLQYPVDLLPKDNQRTQHGSHMYSNSKLQVVGTIDTEKV